MEATITFADGSVITAERNGDSFIANERPDFPADLSTVTVVSEDATNVYNNARVVECASVDHRFWWTFVETPAEELVKLRMQDNIRTIAQLTDIDLEAEDPAKEISLKERINDLEIAICELMDAFS